MMKTIAAVALLVALAYSLSFPTEGIAAFEVYENPPTAEPSTGLFGFKGGKLHYFGAVIRQNEQVAIVEIVRVAGEDSSYVVGNATGVTLCIKEPYLELYDELLIDPIEKAVKQAGTFHFHGKTCDKYVATSPFGGEGEYVYYVESGAKHPYGMEIYESDDSAARQHRAMASALVLDTTFVFVKYDERNTSFPSTKPAQCGTWPMVPAEVTVTGSVMSYPAGGAPPEDMGTFEDVYSASLDASLHEEVHENYWTKTFTMRRGGRVNTYMISTFSNCSCYSYEGDSVMNPLQGIYGMNRVNIVKIGGKSYGEWVEKDVMSFKPSIFNSMAYVEEGVSEPKWYSYGSCTESSCRMNVVKSFSRTAASSKLNIPLGCEHATCD